MALPTTSSSSLTRRIAKEIEDAGASDLDTGSASPVVRRLSKAIDERSSGLGIGDMAVGSSFVIRATDYAIRQRSADSGGTWGPRDGASILFVGDSAFLIGGWAGSPYDSGWPSGTTTNQVYRSDDFGLTWTLVRAHDLTPDDTHFTPKHTFNSLVHRIDGKEYMYIIGGDTFDTTTDVKRSTDGIEWETVAADGTLPFDGVYLSFAGELNGVLYVCGGTTSLTAAGHVDTVWKSTDHGRTWVSMGSAPWSSRSTVDRLISFNNKLWLVSGGVYDDSRVYYNDVWSFDGSTWTEVLADGHTQFVGRQYANTFAFDGYMYLSRGFNVANLDDSYRSKDGLVWERIESPLLGASHADGCGVHSTGVLIASGNGKLSGSPVNTDSPTFFLSREPRI